MRAAEIEIAVAEHFDIRRNLIVPNVSWGMGFPHEIDMLVVSGSGYATEIEIKISKSDILRDQKKRKWKSGIYSKYGDIYRTRDTIKSVYFAIPDILIECAGEIPEMAGILLVGTQKYSDRFIAWEHRKPQTNKTARRLSDAERYKIARLGTMRIWSLKRKLLSQET
jgi:hypothetical protein